LVIGTLVLSLAFRTSAFINWSNEERKRLPLDAPTGAARVTVRDKMQL